VKLRTNPRLWKETETGSYETAQSELRLGKCPSGKWVEEGEKGRLRKLSSPGLAVVRLLPVGMTRLLLPN
jgi:hypothetical protein